MKRILCLILIVCLLLSGCSMIRSKAETVTFYYIRSEYRFGNEGSVIVAEERESTGHRQDLPYLLALYLMGPMEESHVIPLPAGTRIFKAEQKKDTVFLSLSQHAKSLSPEEFTLACACLSLTCLELTDAKEVTVTCEDNSITMTRDILTLYDNGAEIQATEETQ